VREFMSQCQARALQRERVVHDDDRQVAG
jgi:hypothetical protein